MNLQEFRRNYSRGRLVKSDMSSDPINQFQQWLQEIMSTDMRDPTAMVLATVDDSNQVNQRYVLLKGVSQEGFVFYTDTSSAKGKEIANNNGVSLLFPWHMYDRQVRIQGRASRLDRQQVDDYFHSRPLPSQLAAFTSKQSQPIESRQQLERQFMLNKDALGDEVPLPERWGGYLIEPTRFEFWQGGEHRLHDRMVYLKVDNNWVVERIQP